jgi:hypothetical protein
VKLKLQADGKNSTTKTETQNYASYHSEPNKNDQDTAQAAYTTEKQAGAEYIQTEYASPHLKPVKVTLIAPIKTGEYV